MALIPKYFSDISASVALTGGTTEATMTPAVFAGGRPATVNRSRVRMPYSSTVWSCTVVRRQLATSFFPSNTPRPVLVLPTSMASSRARVFRAIAFRINPNLKIPNPKQTQNPNVLNPKRRRPHLRLELGYWHLFRI